MKKITRAYAVIWVSPGAVNYGEKHGTLIESVDERYDACAIFKKKNLAKKWFNGNKDWKIVPCTITYSLPHKD